MTMHSETRAFVTWAFEQLPEYAKEGRTVIDIGSCDPEGFVRSRVRGRYVGIDVCEGPNVDCVSVASKAPVADMSADVVVCCGTLEHDMHFDDTLTKAYNMLRRGGLFLVTCATTGHWEYGTERAQPEASLTATLDSEWKTYYKNLTVADIKGVFEAHGVSFDDLMFDYAFYTNDGAKELYCIAIKRSDDAAFLPTYPSCECTDRPRRARGLVYVTCTSKDEFDRACDSLHDVPWARPVVLPTSMFGEYTAFLHTVPSRCGEWMHADCVAAIPWARCDVPALRRVLDVFPSVSADVVTTCIPARVAKDAVPETLWSWMCHAIKCATDVVGQDVGCVWAMRPDAMAKLCALLKTMRLEAEFPPVHVLKVLWSEPSDRPSHLAPVSPDEAMRAWGTVQEPWHRVLMSYCVAVFCATVHVLSLNNQNNV